MTHICVSKLTNIGSDNGLSPGRRQAIIWTNAGILLIGPLGTNFSENLIGIQTFSLKKIRLKMSSAKWRPFCLGLNVLKDEFTSPWCLRSVDANVVARHPALLSCDMQQPFLGPYIYWATGRKAVCKPVGQDILSMLIYQWSGIKLTYLPVWAHCGQMLPSRQQPWYWVGKMGIISTTYVTLISRNDLTSKCTFCFF